MSADSMGDVAVNTTFLIASTRCVDRLSDIIMVRSYLSLLLRLNKIVSNGIEFWLNSTSSVSKVSSGNQINALSLLLLNSIILFLSRLVLSNIFKLGLSTGL